jgi:hypothetical protein
MSIDFNVKPVGSPVATPIVRPEPDAARTAVSTELPAPQSVAAAEGATTSSAAAGNGNAGSKSGQSIARQVIYDQAAAEMVYVAVDKDTAEVLNQYPESWQLKARAYFREQDQSKLQRSSAMATDRFV